MDGEALSHLCQGPKKRVALCGVRCRKRKSLVLMFRSLAFSRLVWFVFYGNLESLVACVFVCCSSFEGSIVVYLGFPAS